MRAHLLWAAIHLASRKNDSDSFHPVLISITANPGYFAGTFIELLEKDWSGQDLPCFFLKPATPSNEKVYEDCLATCADYFGEKSREYRLLKHGIVLHHGKMPQSMSGLLIQLVKNNIINIVLATSTLSEGVNLPVETVLIPTLVRHPDVLSAKEFSNLIGRAGRPGNATEGRSLVLVHATSRRANLYKSQQQYKKIIKKLSAIPKESELGIDVSEGPLSALIHYIFKKWSTLTKSENSNEFIAWLETAQGISNDACFALDTLDGLLLSAIHEFEEMDDKQVDMEIYLKDLWRQTFSSYAKEGKAIYPKVFQTRGNALVKNIYPDKSRRTALYNTSLPPRDGTLILQDLDEFIVLLQDGVGYVKWGNKERFEYLLRLIDAVRIIPSFAFSDERYISIRELLAWWMWPNDIATKKPKPPSLSEWYKLGSKNFNYLFNWGIGSLIGAIINQDGLSGTTMERWQDAGLPWSIIWIKDLISLGIYDPVSAFLLSHKRVLTRLDAHEMAKGYWTQVDMSEGDLLFDPCKVKKWFDHATTTPQKVFNGDYAKISIPIKPLVDIEMLSSATWKVLPILSKDSIIWYDAAGYSLAESKIPKEWSKFSEKSCAYILNTKKAKVNVSFE